MQHKDAIEKKVEAFRLEVFAPPMCLREDLVGRDFSDIRAIHPMERGAFTDQEAAIASNVPERSLRTLQSATTLRSFYINVSGRSQRFWCIYDVIKASICDQIKHCFGLDYKTAGEIVSSMTEDPIKNDEIDNSAVSRPYKRVEPLDKGALDGWVSDVVTMNYLFPVYISSIASSVMPDPRFKSCYAEPAPGDDYFLTVTNNRFVFLDLPKRSDHVNFFFEGNDDVREGSIYLGYLGKILWWNEYVPHPYLKSEALSQIAGESEAVDRGLSAVNAVRDYAHTRRKNSEHCKSINLSLAIRAGIQRSFGKKNYDEDEKMYELIQNWRKTAKVAIDYILERDEERKP